MVIDFHTHVFPENMAMGTIAQMAKKAGIPAALNGTVSELLASMNQSDVDCSVIVPVVTSPRQFASVNRFAKEINEQFGKTASNTAPRLISFGGIHPDSGDYRAQLQELKGMGFVGIKLHPDYQGVNFDDIRYQRIVSYASELDMIVLVHAGIDVGILNPVRCTPNMAARVLKSTQADKLVLAHLGGWKLWDEVEELLVGSKAFLDTAFIHQYIDKEQFCRIVNNHGSDRILFATDSPWSEQREAVQWLQDCKLLPEVKDCIFYKNALTLLKECF